VIQRVQALADISRCHSNATRAPIANPPNSAQLEGTPTIPSSHIRVRYDDIFKCFEDYQNLES